MGTVTSRKQVDLSDLQLQLPSANRFDVQSIIKGSKVGTKSASSSAARQVVPDGVEWRADFTSKEYRDLDIHLKVGWWAIIAHGDRERYAEIVHVAKRRIRVRRTVFKNGLTYTYTQEIKAVSLRGVIKVGAQSCSP